MQGNEQEDRLTHVLLGEVIGLEPPPDLTEKILTKVAQRTRWVWAARLSLAAAAVVVVSLLAWGLGRRPALGIGGGCRVEGGGQVGWGSIISAPEESGALTFGKLWRVELAPRSVVHIEGRPGAEELVLRRGSLRCRVSRSVGQFNVRTEAGTVSAKGGNCELRLAQKRGNDAMSAKQVLVHVVAGAALISGAWGELQVQAGEEATAPPVVALGTIKAGKPQYRQKTAGAWRERGRIVGHVRQAPAFEVGAIDARGKVAKAIEGKAGAKAYELEWLNPGVYTLRVRANGYHPLELPGLEVRSRHDLFVAVEFTPPGETAHTPSAGTAEGAHTSLAGAVLMACPQGRFIRIKSPAASGPVVAMLPVTGEAQATVKGLHKGEHVKLTTAVDPETGKTSVTRVERLAPGGDAK